MRTLALLVVLGLVACGGARPGSQTARRLPPPDVPPSAPVSEPLTLGLVVSGLLLVLLVRRARENRAGSRRE